MKRWFGLLLAVLLVISCAFTVLAAADNDIDFEVLLGIKAYVSSVEELDVEVKEDYGTMTFIWTPDAAAKMVFSLVDTSANGMTFTVEQDDTVVSSNNGQASIAVNAGTAVTIVVKTKNESQGEATLLGREILGGDVSGDGKVDTLDGLLLMRYLNGWDITIPDPQAMDVNADGKVNSLDGLLLMRYLNGWDVTLK